MGLQNTAQKLLSCKKKQRRQTPDQLSLANSLLCALRRPSGLADEAENFALGFTEARKTSVPLLQKAQGNKTRKEYRTSLAPKPKHSQNTEWMVDRCC
jgi:hypothetical protein